MIKEKSGRNYPNFKRKVVAIVVILWRSTLITIQKRHSPIGRIRVRIVVGMDHLLPKRLAVGESVAEDATRGEAVQSGKDRSALLRSSCKILASILHSPLPNIFSSAPFSASAPAFLLSLHPPRVGFRHLMAVRLNVQRM